MDPYLGEKLECQHCYNLVYISKDPAKMILNSESKYILEQFARVKWVGIDKYTSMIHTPADFMCVCLIST